MTMTITADGTPIDDDRLVDSWVIHGDEDSFREIYRRHTPAMYRLAIGLVGDEEDAADVIQEVWIRASRRMGRFGRRSALRTWLCGITVNCCREWRRKIHRKVMPDIRVQTIGADRSASIDLLRSLASLPTRAREVLVLYGVAGYTHEEVGEILGISAGTSKSQLSYARKLLRERMHGREGGDDDERQA